MTATLSRQLLAGPLDIELQGRVAAAAAQARALLGDAVEADAASAAGTAGAAGAAGGGGRCSRARGRAPWAHRCAHRAAE